MEPCKKVVVLQYTRLSMTRGYYSRPAAGIGDFHTTSSDARGGQKTQFAKRRKKCRGIRSRG